MYIHIFFAAQPRKDSSRCLGIWHPIHTVHSSSRIFQSHAKTKCGNPPTYHTKMRPFFFWRIFFKISYLHFMFGEVKVQKILVMHSWRWDESFQISASIRTCPFLLNLWGEGEGRFFWGSGYFNKSDIVLPVWSLYRAPKFYQRTMQCVNAQLN